MSYVLHRPPPEERAAEEAVAVAGRPAAEKTAFMRRTVDEMLDHARNLCE